jgi:hypothetical protein
MNRTLITSIISTILFFTSAMSGHVSYAAQLDDVTLPDLVRLDGTDTELQINGLGYRTKFVFKIYVGALYTENKVTTRDEVQALRGPKRVVMHMVYDEVSADKMASAWRDGFEDNNSDEKLAVLQDRLQVLIGYFDTMKAGDVVLLDYIPGTGTRVTIRGEHKGDIAGEDFYAALLDVWLGEEPADDDLKDAMLGIVDQ